MLSALGDALTQFADSVVALFIEELITSGDVFGFFAGDPLGNLDKDPNLILENVREPMSREFPFLPIRDNRGLVSTATLPTSSARRT